MYIEKNMRIETERLIIRPYQLEDLMACYKLMQDESLFKYIDLEVMSEESYKRLFTWLIDSYKVSFTDEFRYSFNITLKSTGQHIGWCGIGALDYDVKHKEVYYLLGKEHWRKGYAKEAVSALIEFSFETIGLSKIVAVCKPENIGSKKVIESMGMKFSHVVEGLPEEYDFYNGELFYSLNKEDFERVLPK